MDASLSFAVRNGHIEAMAGGPLDMLVIGGGITGAGIVRDAAMRGFRTALVERDDFAAGASGNSSRLVHGGLRYLEYGRLQFVRQASRERRHLQRIAPHLVWPCSFLVPVFAGGRLSRWKLLAALATYDALALFRNVGRHRWLSKRALLRTEPGLRERDLTGGARYWDAQCDDSRLTVATVRDAHRAGAHVANYAEVEQLEFADGRVRGARINDRATGTTFAVHAPVVVNATGAWSDKLRGDGRRLLRPTRGTHVAVRRDRIGCREAVTLASPIDGRIMFIVPWERLAYIGTTDIDCQDPPDEVRATGDDVVYLLRSANAVFPDARLHPDDVVSTWTGIRPLVRASVNEPPSAVSRSHQIVERSGMLSVIGGKLTTHRIMAAQVVDRAARLLHELDGRSIPPRAPTQRVPLPGGEVRDLDLLVRDAQREGAAPDVARRLVRYYGSETPAIVRLAQADARLGERVVPDHPAIRAELIHAVRREMAVTFCDLMIRRTRLFFDIPRHCAEQAPALVGIVAEECGWDADRREAEVAAYLQEIDRNDEFRDQLTDHPAP